MPSHLQNLIATSDLSFLMLEHPASFRTGGHSSSCCAYDAHVFMCDLAHDETTPDSQHADEPRAISLRMSTRACMNVVLARREATGSTALPSICGFCCPISLILLPYLLLPILHLPSAQLKVHQRSKRISELTPCRLSKTSWMHLLEPLKIAAYRNLNDQRPFTRTLNRKARLVL